MIGVLGHQGKENIVLAERIGEGFLEEVFSGHSILLALVKA